MRKYKNKLSNNIEEIYKNSVIRKSKIEDDIGLVRIDKYMGNRFSYYSRNKWQDLIGQGLVLLNGERIKYTREVKKGDEITYHLIGLKEPEVDKNIQIVYDDGDLIIANKPANLPVIPSGKYYYNTLHTIIKDKFNCKINMLNRIDRETSGCVVLSRGNEVASKFCKMLQSKNKKLIKKTYIALIENAQNIEASFTVEGYMEEVGHKDFRRYQILKKEKTENSKYSKTKFKTLKKIGNEYAIVMCRLYTGRMHQIRVHLHSLGYYMIGDKVYGKYGPSVFQDFIKKDKIPDGFFNRQALHSYKLEFNHPITKEKIKVKAPLTKDLKELIKKLTNS